MTNHPLTRRDLLVGATVANISLAGCSSLSLPLTSNNEWSGKRLTRLAILPTGAEVTGLHLGPDGTLFMNVQHPSSENEPPFGSAVVGAFRDPLADLPEDFESVQVPDSDVTTVKSSWTEYDRLVRGGAELRDGSLLGVPKTPNGRPLTNGQNPDMNVFVPLDDNAGLLYTNWESKPGMVSRMRIERSAPGKEWQLVAAENLDFRDVEGTWRNCFGTLSPWGTPLSSEELYFEDTSKWNRLGENEGHPPYGVDQLYRYLGHFPNPYRYGYIVEIQDPKAKDPTPVKQWALGRFSHENALVMPDQRTVYLSDDGNGTGFFKFVADAPADLSAGTLYAAKAHQDAGRDPSEVGFELEWVRLAHGERDQIESWIAEYDDVGVDDYEAGATSYISNEEIQAWARGEADDDRAAFLETRKAAKAAGATVEFNKMEGIHARLGAEPGDYLYMAMSGLTHAMADEEGDIQMDGTEYGAVYRLPIEEDYDVRRMEPAIVGGPKGNVCGGCPYDAAPDSSDVCEDCVYNPASDADAPTTLSEENTLANPDNLAVMPDGRVVVGEDSSVHDNSMLWVYAPGSGGEADA